jgi:hypothetical protein
MALQMRDCRECGGPDGNDISESDDDNPNGFFNFTKG